MFSINSSRDSHDDSRSLGLSYYFSQINKINEEDEKNEESQMIGCKPALTSNSPRFID